MVRFDKLPLDLGEPLFDLRFNLVDGLDQARHLFYFTWRNFQTDHDILVSQLQGEKIENPGTGYRLNNDLFNILPVIAAGGLANDQRDQQTMRGRSRQPLYRSG